MVWKASNWVHDNHAPCRNQYELLTKTNILIYTMLVRYTWITYLCKGTSDIYSYYLKFRSIGLLRARDFPTSYIVFYLLALFRILPFANNIFSVVTLLLFIRLSSRLRIHYKSQNLASDWSLSTWTACTIVSWRHLAADEADGARLVQCSCSGRGGGNVSGTPVFQVAQFPHKL